MVFNHLIPLCKPGHVKLNFLGNSVTVQKEGYAYKLASLIYDYFPPTQKFIFAGMGGKGSQASCYLMENFVLRHQTYFCFVECTVADIGYATPPKYLKTSFRRHYSKTNFIVHKIMFPASIQDTYVTYTFN